MSLEENRPNLVGDMCITIIFILCLPFIVIFLIVPNEYIKSDYEIVNRTISITNCLKIRNCDCVVCTYQKCSINIFENKIGRCCGPGCKIKDNLWIEQLCETYLTNCYKNSLDLKLGSVKTKLVIELDGMLNTFEEYTKATDGTTITLYHKRSNKYDVYLSKPSDNKKYIFGWFLTSLIIFITLFIIFSHCKYYKIQGRRGQGRCRQRRNNELNKHNKQEIKCSNIEDFELQRIKTEDKMCVICLETINSDGIKLNKCKHIYHNECINNVLDKKCPLCKTEMV